MACGQSANLKDIIGQQLSHVNASNRTEQTDLTYVTERTCDANDDIYIIPNNGEHTSHSIDAVPEHDAQRNEQEHVLENIRLHKELIQSVKIQHWPIGKKVKLVRQVNQL